jgi:hypothetical protein
VFSTTPRFRPRLESLSDRCLPSATSAGNLLAGLSADLTREFDDSLRGDAIAVAGDQFRVAADLQAVQSAIRVAVVQLGVENIKVLTVASKTVTRAVVELETGFSFIRVAVASVSIDPAFAARAYQSGIAQVTRGLTDFIFDPNIASAQTALSVLDESLGQLAFALGPGPVGRGL